MSGRWELAGVAVVAAGVGLFLVTKHLSEREHSRRKPLDSVVVGILAILLLIDVTFVIEAVAHVIWPKFVDPGS